jgi:hypothetical protein
LPSVTGIGKNFLITGEAGIENNFAAAARDRASRTAVKYAPVFQRQNCGSMQNLDQCVLRLFSLAVFHWRNFHFSCASAVADSEPK